MAAKDWACLAVLCALMLACGALEKAEDYEWSADLPGQTAR